MSATIPQIKARMDAGHAEVIEQIEADRPLSDIRRAGWLRRLETLLRWECVSIGVGSGGYVVTDKGRRALRAMRQSCGSAT